MKLRIEKSVTVITPSIGSMKLQQALRSVKSQTYKNLNHLIVVDGPQYENAVRFMVNGEASICVLQENTGANGFNGQRIYASFPHLLNSDYIFFLDEDNWYDPMHVQSLVETIERNYLDFAYSLRKIYRHDEQFVAEDNCESLGKWPIFFTHDNPQYLIDTSCYAFKREFIQKTCHLWHSGAWGEDRRYFQAVKDHAKWDTSGKHSMCYRLEGNKNSVQEDFFHQGNKLQEAHFKGVFPWKTA